MNRIYLFLFAVILSGVFCVNLSAQNPKITIEDVFVKGTYNTRGVNSLHWMEDGVSYSALEANKEVGGLDIVSYDIKTGERKVVLSAEKLIPDGLTKPLRLRDYSFSSDKTKMLIFTNTDRVWRYNTRGDYWILDMNTYSLQQLGKGFEPKRLMFAKISPSGDKVAYVYKNNIYMEVLSSGEIIPLTEDGNEDIINGTFDWVYEEELNDRDGFRWSPDGQKIAFWHFDTRGTGVFNIIDNIDSLYSYVIPFPYPKVGTTNSDVKVGAVDVNTRSIKWFDLPGDPRNHYIARIEFVPNSNEVMIQQLNRLQNTNKVYYGDVETMQLNQFMTDTDETFLNIHDNIKWLDKDKYFTWTSEKDGWRHLYKVSKDGLKETLITKGDFDVINVYLIDTKGGYLYYSASPESAVEQFLYRSRLDGKGAAERITPLNEAGTHLYNISPDAKHALHIYSDNATPTQYELISLPKHKTVRVLEDNANVRRRYDSLGLNVKEYFKVDIGEVALDGWMIKPTCFDSTKLYPVIFYIYGEPGSSTVQNSWSGRDLWNQVLAQQGYIVMSVDPRGTNNPRGREWRKCVYGKVGIIPPADHAAAVLKIEEMFPYVDKTRIGIWGWSGGGSSTAHAMFKYPEIYRTGIAVAGVYSQLLYDSIYQERYMGLPSSNPDGFFNGSPINFAGNLKGDLLLIHGTGDDNVHYQSLEMLVNELIKQNKMFEMMSYPMRSHSIYERENTTYHLYQTMMKYWLEHLPIEKN